MADKRKLLDVFRIPRVLKLFIAFVLLVLFCLLAGSCWIVFKMWEIAIAFPVVAPQMIFHAFLFGCMTGAKTSLVLYLLSIICQRASRNEIYVNLDLRSPRPASGRGERRSKTRRVLGRQSGVRRGRVPVGQEANQGTKLAQSQSLATPTF